VTIQQFFNEAEEYYGHYKPIEKKYIAKWLTKWSEKDIGEIFARTLKMYSNRWGKPPDIAVLEDAESEIDRGHPDITPDREYRRDRLLEEEAVSDEQAAKYFAQLKRQFGCIARKGKEAGDGKH
jgi:hypothetical protein